MPSTVDMLPAQLAKYLQIAANQRKRAAAKFVQDYGPSSATVVEVQGEIADLDQTISKLLKDQAAGPHSKNK